MDLLGGLGIICSVLGLLAVFISLITTSWFTFSLNGSPTHYFGLYQSCTVYGCAIDWFERSAYAQGVLFSMVGASVILLAGVVLCLVAHIKSRDLILLIAAPFSTVGGCVVLSATAVYTVQALEALEESNLLGYPAFFYGYALAWTACGLSFLAAIFMFIKGCRATKTMVTHL